MYCNESMNSGRQGRQPSFFTNARARVMIMLWVCWMAIMLGAARVATDRDRTPHEKYPT
jgi:hypothetical protein